MKLTQELKDLISEKASEITEEKHQIEKEVEEQVKAEVKQDYLRKRIDVNLGYGYASIHILRNHPSFLTA